MKIPFSPPDITEAEIEQVAEALRSGWITTGPKTKELEREVADLCGTNRAVCLNSQTACAEMTLRLLGIHEGDEVITCAYTYTASASVVCHVGAKLVLIDTQEDSLEMDYDKLAEAITEKTKVIIPVDLGGVPCDYDRIFSIVEEKKKLFHPVNKLQEAIGRVIVMADAAHAFGATWHGKPVGSIADFSNFSFHAVKNFTTAEGGAVAWRDIEGIDNEEITEEERNNIENIIAKGEEIELWDIELERITKEECDKILEVDSFVLKGNLHDLVELEKEVNDINYRKTALKNIMEIEEWCKEQFEGKPEYSRRTPRTDIKGIKTAKEERELGLGKALSNFKQSTIWKNYQEGKEKGLSREEIKQEYGMREGEIALVERYERIIEEYDVKKKITGQSIGQVSYTATVQECDEAQTDLNKLIHEQQEITQKD